MKKQFNKQLMSLLLVVCLLFGLAAPAAAVPDSKISFTKVDNSAVSADLLTKVSNELKGMDEYLPTEAVRVSIFLEDDATIMAGYSIENIAANAQAVAYRADLKAKQSKITAAIEQALGEKLDVVWNLTLAANLISANIKYGQIAQIEKVPGVREVLVETLYAPDVVKEEQVNDPNMGTSSAQIGSPAAWAAGYTGAGSRIAVIDTGVDTDHQSMNADAFQYSLAHVAGTKGMSVEEYMEQIDLLDAAEIDAVADQLNAPVTGSEAYINAKLPFGYNYVDGDLDVTHDNDTQGGHGSHVSGIATANAYLYTENGFVSAMDSAMVQGVAPDAQLITMKVFGKGGGAYNSDYMAAIEDAIVLGCDAANLSLGSGNPGTSKNATAEYQAIMESLAECGMVVAMSAGNSGSWVEAAYNAGYLYNTDVSMHTGGSPGSYTNSLGVASVDNDGSTGYYVDVNGMMIVYNETTGYSNEPFVTIAGEHEYVFVDGLGTAEDWAAVGDALAGKIALCWRGEISFYEKADFAVEAGAIATFICNNQPGIINMDLTDYGYDAPCASLTQADGLAIMAASTPVTDADGNVLYYTGKMTVGESLAAGQFNSPNYTMSSFSSWGVPGSLELKPEITAPGGSIYSIDGEPAETDKYVVMSGTSMASPQVAGMAAVVAQYIAENDLVAKTGLSNRQLAQSLLMSTAVPMLDANGSYYSLMQQGSGLANVGAATSADSYITMADDANAGAADGKVKVELGDDPAKNGEYTATFTINNLQDVEKNFALSADFFIQAPTMDNLGNLYMYTSTALIGMDVSWTVDGNPIAPSADLSGMDFNADGVVTADDGQALLDYATGAVETLNAMDKADLDADGDVDSHDAYLFLNALTTGTATVAANGCATVTVTMTLSADWKATLDYYYPNGTYIQGYLFAESLTDDEGNAGTSHSIPVLGFFGNWTDPSMYDVGTYQEYATGDETRTPYLNNAEGNTWAVTYANEPDAKYFLGGNPMVPDDTYLPERNAINSNDIISGLSFIAIRNVAASKFSVTNLTTGEVLGENDELGAIDSAYYYSNGGYWNNTGYNLNTALAATGGNEGDQIYAALTLAPEYYVDDEGNVDWDALGKGATFDLTMTVDNTAPELMDISMSLTGKTMTVTASDNEYIAAVALFNKAGNKALAYTGAKQEIAKGETAEYTFDISGVNGKKFLLQVMDYAMNTTTYLIETQIGEEQPLPEMIAFYYMAGWWTSFDQTTEYMDITEYAPSDYAFTAATIVDHMVLAVTLEGDMYVMPETDLTDTTYVANVGTMINDMAYNKADGKVYGVDPNGDLVTIDKLDGTVTTVGNVGVLTNTLACDANGTFYCNEYGTSKVYSFTLDTLDAPELLATCVDGYNAEFVSQYAQSMEVNPNTGMICWNSYYTELFWGIFEIGYAYYIEIDPTTGESTTYEDYWDQFTALIIPEKTTGGGWTTPTDEVSGLTLSTTELNLLKGGKATLSANVTPWTATDRTVSWTSDNEDVVTIDENGNVQALAEGTATITATSNLDPSFTATCTVNVETLKVTIEGTLQDVDGNPMFYSWNMGSDDTWTAGAALDTSMTSATYSTKEDAYYIVDAASNSWSMHKVAPDGTELAVAANAAQVPLWDMQYSDYFSGVREKEMVSSIYYYYFLSPKDPMNLDTMAFNLSSRVNYLTAIASMGYEEYWDEEEMVMLDTEHILMLDDAGIVWDFWIYDTEDGMSAWLASTPSNLPCTFPGDDQMENMYTSMVVGDDGCLYVSSFNGETNELYRMTYNEATASYDAAFIGDVGQDVWPATLTKVTTNDSAEEGNAFTAPKATEKLSAVTVSAEELANASIQTIKTPIFTMTAEAKAAKAEMLKPNSDSVVDAAEEFVTVTVTADTLATNGVATVTWDTDALTLNTMIVNGEYTAKVEADGSVTFGYVSLNGIAAGDAIATLNFAAKKTEPTTVTIEHKQLNNAAGATETVNVEFTHANTEVKDAVAATCTTEGYTGDTYCTDCGMLIAKGEVIPAIGHSFGEWTVLVEAGCTTDGLKARTCTACGHTENELIAATGTHANTEVKDAAAATCTEDGYTGDTYCTDCGILIAKGEIIPATGHTFGDWTVDVEATCTTDGMKARTCTACGHTETETIPAACASANFADVAADAWFHDAVDYVVENGLMNGMSQTTFNPAGTMNRAQMVTVLYRMAGSPAVTEATPFTDVAPESFYADAVAWAYANDIVKGVSDTAFNPNGDVTREQMVTFLARYAKLAGKDMTTTGDLSAYTDADTVSGWAVEAMTWAVENGLITGMSDNTLEPTGTTNRAQVATVLMRFAA